MIKMVGLFRIKAGMSRDAFIDYYEKRHVPLILALLPQIIEYRRSYVLADGSFVAGHVGGVAPQPPFDVLTEVWFQNRAAYDSMCAATSDPAIGGRIAQDEENLFDRSHMIMCLVEEHGGQPSAR
jgi:EthD domain